MTITFRHHSACVRIAALPGSKRGVIEVRNTGVFTLEAFNYFLPKVIAATVDAPAIVVRLDTAADLLFEPPAPTPGAYPQGVPEQAVVVSDDHYIVWMRHAHNLESFGVRRAVFKKGHLAAALQWAESSAMDRLSRQRDPSPSGATPLE